MPSFVYAVKENEYEQALQGAKVAAVEVQSDGETSWIVLRFENGITLYADEPNVYRPV